MKELELIVGARVYCRNGKFGRLAKIAVEPRHWRVTHIIVEEGFLRKRYRLLPISIVEQATTGDVYLAVCDEEMTRFPEYEAVDNAPSPVQEAGEGQPNTPSAETGNGLPRTPQGLAPGLVVVERGTPIENLDGTVGRLDYMLVSADDGQITGLVLQQRMIPNSMVQHIDGERISVAAIPGEGSRARS